MFLKKIAEQDGGKHEVAVFANQCSNLNRILPVCTDWEVKHEHLFNPIFSIFQLYSLGYNFEFIKLNVFSWLSWKVPQHYVLRCLFETSVLFLSCICPTLYVVPVELNYHFTRKIFGSCFINCYMIRVFLK